MILKKRLLKLVFKFSLDGNEGNLPYIEDAVSISVGLATAVDDSAAAFSL